MVDAAGKKVAVPGLAIAAEDGVAAVEVEVASDQCRPLRAREDPFEQVLGLGGGELGVAVCGVDAHHLERQNRMVDPGCQSDAPLEAVAVGLQAPGRRVGDGKAAENCRPLLEAEPAQRAVGAGVDRVQIEVLCQAVGETAFADRAPGFLEDDDVRSQASDRGRQPVRALQPVGIGSGLQEAPFAVRVAVVGVQLQYAEPVCGGRRRGPCRGAGRPGFSRLLVGQERHEGRARCRGQQAEAQDCDAQRRMCPAGKGSHSDRGNAAQRSGGESEPGRARLDDRDRAGEPGRRSQRHSGQTGG